MHHKLQNKYPQVRAFSFPPKKAIGNKVGAATAAGRAALRLVPPSSPSTGDLNIWAPLYNSKSWLIREKRWEQSKPTIRPPKDSRVTSCLRVHPLISLEQGCHTCSAKRPESKCPGFAAPYHFSQNTQLCHRGSSCRQCVHVSMPVCQESFIY